MSRGINKAIIVGRLGNDPDTRYLPNGDAVCNISVATSESWTDKNTGQPQERTEWHRITAFRRLAEIMGQYLRKGSQVYIEGKIQTRKWQAQDGSDRYSTEIIADQMQMLGGRSDGQSGGSANFGQNAPAQPQSSGAAQQAPQPGNQPAEFKKPQIDHDDDFGDDIPF